jgi:ATP-dependent Clp protease adaptor protein ClpS
MAGEDQKTGEAVAEKTRTSTRRPPMYQVFLHNDDYTAMEFVVEVLESIFHRSPAEAHRVMMQVHTQGLGVAGTYPHEIAETKVSLTHDRARERGYPLRASLEEA